VASPETVEAPSSDPAAPFAVVEDEPLAPGEPLIDLSDLHTESASETQSETAPQESADDGLGGSWLDAPSEPAAGAPTPEPAADTAREDALTEALLTGIDLPEAMAAAPDPTPSAEPPAAPPQPSFGADASPDAVAVRQLILDALAAGQPREAIEQYLRDQLGMIEPGVLIDAALNANG
jgi:hypothetical protein